MYAFTMVRQIFEMRYIKDVKIFLLQSSAKGGVQAENPM